MRSKKLLYVVFSFSLLLSINLSAQDLAQQKIDSLFTLANSIKAKAGDSLRIVATNLIMLSEQEGNELGLVKGKLMASLYLVNKMKLDSSHFLLDECEAYFKVKAERAQSKEAALRYYLLAEIAMRRSQFAEAEIFAFKALKIYKDKKADSSIAVVLLQLGKINSLKESYSQALDFYFQALEHKINTGAHVSTYKNELRMIAGIYQKMGQYDKALTYLRKSYVPNATDEDNNSNLFKSIGYNHQLQNNLDSAMYYYQLAKGLISPADEKAAYAAVELDIAEVSALMGNFKESNTILLNLLRQNGSTHNMLNSRIWSRMALNYLKLNKMDSALNYGTKAYHAVEGSGLKFETINSSYVLSEVFKVKARFDSAYYYSDIYHINKDSLFNIENQRKLSTLYAEIETLAKEKEIEALEKQKEIDAIHNRNLVLIIVLGSIALISLLLTVILFYRNSQKKQILGNLMLQQELNKRDKDLHDQALKMIYMNNSFVEVEESLKRLHLQSPDAAKDVRQLLSNLQLNKTLDKEWDNFNQYFGNVHGDFFKKINTDFPDLSTSEKRLASLIRMNLTNREIASILNIESSSVKIAKYRLKKKLSLNEEVDIYSFLQKLN